MVEELSELVSSVENIVQSLGEEELSYKPNTKKWSKKEILGHLIDSSVNNFKRLTEAQFDIRFLLKPITKANW